MELLATPGGGLLAYSGADDRVLGSADGGRTWRPLGEVNSEGNYRAKDLAVGPNGRLYAALSHVFMSPPVYGGVWQTVDPVFAVADEASPERAEAGGLALSVAPNPSSSRVTIEVSGLGPEAVRVTVVDALGREVAVVWDGSARDGQRLAVDTAGWPAGMYHVRAVTERGEARASLTVVR